MIHVPSENLRTLSHCRRKFVAALDAKDMRAAVPISLFAQLYAIEAKAREDKIGPDELLARRQALSRPLMDRLGEVVEGLRGKAVPKSPMGKAITYAINQWSTLTAFLTDGRIPIDNLHVERRHRVVALGRRYPQYPVMRRCSPRPAIFGLVPRDRRHFPRLTISA